MFTGQKVVHFDAVANIWVRAPGEPISSFALESRIDEFVHEDPTKGTKFSIRNWSRPTNGARTSSAGRRDPESQSQRDGKWLIDQDVATGRDCQRNLQRDFLEATTF
jgi:hypothetical protein